MASKLFIAQGNTAPSWAITCERTDGTIINLTGCTVTVIIAKGSNVTNTGGAATITNAAGGIISYHPLVTDTPTAGTYKVDVKIVYSDLSNEVLYDQLQVKARKRIIAAS